MRSAWPKVHYEHGTDGPLCGTRNVTDTSEIWAHVTCRRCLARRSSTEERTIMSIELKACPFCNAQMLVRVHSAFHPVNSCWLARAGEFAGPLELSEDDYEDWNTRPTITGDDYHAWAKAQG